MNCDFSDLKQETINYKGVNLEDLFFLLYLTGYLATYCFLLLVAHWRPQISHV